MAQLTPMLTIAIPTYNRSVFLKRNLGYLYSQKKDFAGQVEIIVSDNGSVDNTSEVVAEFKAKGLAINHLKNTENKGADFNIAQCYNTATGQYILVMGDDDILLEHSVSEILSIISKHGDAGIIYLSNLGFKDNLFTDVEVDIPVNYSLYRDKRSFLHRVTYHVTFISANIVNRKAIEQVDMMQWKDTNLIQVPAILTAMKGAPYNVIVHTKILATQTENTGGYNIFEIFGKKLNYVTSSIFTGGDSYLKNIIMNDVFVGFFPFWTQRLKHENNFTVNLKTDEIEKLINFNKYYMLFIKPLLRLSNTLSKLYFYTIKVYALLRKKYYLLKYTK
jgi:abequosyltransferase